MLTLRYLLVNLGPFVDYKSRWIGASARELFDFAQNESQVSKDYHAALTIILKAGVRIAYVGSIDDQLVSLDVSLPSATRANSSTKPYLSVVDVRND